MIYAITTHSFLVIVEFDRDWKIRNYQVLNKGYHYGIALMERDGNDSEEKDSIRFVAYRGGDAVSNQNDRQLMIYEGNKSFDLIATIALGDGTGDIHQITYANGGLYIVNTRYNSVVFRNLETDVRHEYFFENIADDRNHVNSLFPCGNQVLVMLHNKGHRESQLAVLLHDVTKGFMLERILSLWHFACHNVFVDGNTLFYNASPVHSLIKVDLEKRRVAGKVSFEGHSKGLSATTDYLVVGLSEDTFRDRRSISKGKLAIIDRHSLSIRSTVDLDFPSLPHPIGNVNEVRCISGGEFAHGTSERLNPEWEKLRLAEGNFVLHHLRRAELKILLPLRNMKKHIRQYI